MPEHHLFNEHKYSRPIHTQVYTMYMYNNKAVAHSSQNLNRLLLNVNQTHCKSAGPNFLTRYSKMNPDFKL